MSDTKPANHRTEALRVLASVWTADYADASEGLLEALVHAVVYVGDSLADRPGDDV